MITTATIIVCSMAAGFVLAIALANYAFKQTFRPW